MKSVKSFFPAFAWLLTGLFAVTIVWLNFHCALWYDHDIFPDAYLGRLMFEQKTLFPSNWVFGNRFFILGTPVLAAFYYAVFQDTVLSMAAASSTMMVLVLFVFIWALYPKIGKKGIAAGTLCMIGGIILGVRASTFKAGLQVLYTMSSYYACYLVVILFTMGVFLRLRELGKVSWWQWVLCVLLNFAVGIHSIREMLLLNIPLVLVEGLDLVRRMRKENYRDVFFAERFKILFAGLMFVVNLAGVLVSHWIPAQVTPAIDPGINLEGAVLWSQFLESSRNLVEIMGLLFPARGLKCYPLFGAALVIVSVVFYSLWLILKYKDTGFLATFIKYCGISVFGVWFAGVFIIHTRPLYFFVYYLLATLCILYLLRRSEEKGLYGWLYAAVLAIGTISYVSHFLPDYLDYRKNDAKARAVAREIVEKGDVDCIFDVYDHPIIAAYSKDRIVSCKVNVDYTRANGYLFSANPSLITNEMRDDAYFGRELISLGRSQYEHILERAPAEYLDEFRESLVLEREDTIGDNTYMLFRPVRRVVGPQVLQ